MTTVILALILILLVILLCVASFVSGYIVADKHRKAAAQSKELTEKERHDLERKNRDAQRRQKELENFWNYNGDAQERINI